jgi:excisionase family DNA binding protein
MPPLPDRTPRTVLLPIPQVAERLSVSQRTVWAMIADGRLPAIRLGSRATRVAADEVEKLIEAARARSAR